MPIKTPSGGGLPPYASGNEEEGYSLDNQLLGELRHYYNPRSYNISTLDNIDDLKNNVQTILDSGVYTVPRPWFTRADSSLGKYHLYYESASSEISLLYSDDGWNWTQYTNNPILTGISTTYGEFQVVKIGSTFHAFLEGDLGSGQGIYHTTSSDGYSDWSTSGTQILTTSSAGWDTFLVFYPAVIHFQGQYFLYYSGKKSTNVCSIGLAIANSPDGPYTKYPGNPILVRDPDSTYLQNIWDPHPTVIDGVIYMVYTGFDGSGEMGMLATSLDGINFRHYEGNPIMPNDQTGQTKTIDLNLVINEGKLRLYFCTGTSNWILNQAEVDLGGVV